MACSESALHATEQISVLLEFSDRRREEQQDMMGGKTPEPGKPFAENLQRIKHTLHELPAKHFHTLFSALLFYPPKITSQANNWSVVSRIQKCFVCL